MDKTKVKVSDLLLTLSNNRTEHEKEFEKAKKEWLKRATKQLRKIADKAEKNQSLPAASFYPLAKLPKPTSYVDSYDTMIARLEWENEEYVELTEREFKAYVLDEWEWHDQFVGTTSLYNTNLR